MGWPQVSLSEDRCLLVALDAMAAYSQGFLAPCTTSLTCPRSPRGPFLKAIQVTVGHPRHSGAKALANEEEGSLPVSLRFA